MNFRKLKSKFVLVAVDITLFYLSLVLAYITIKFLDGIFYNYSKYISVNIGHIFYTFWIPTIWLFFMLYENVYDTQLPSPEKLKRLIKANFFSFILAFFIVGIGKLSDEVSRLMVIILFTYLTLISILSRSLIESILKNIGLITKNVVIVGLDDTAIKIATSILKKTLPNHNILFFVDRKEGKIKIENQEFDVKKLQNIKRLIILNKNIDTIIISEGAFEKEEAEDIILKINSLFKEIIIVPNLKLWNVLNLEHVPAYTLDILMLKSKNNLKSVFSNILKYCFDYVIIVILIPILIIVIPIIALLIKLDSKGPVFYIQERIGKNGKIFKVIKFRTMYINSQEILEKFLQENKDALLEWQTYKKLKSYDPRVTRVGRFLRKTSLDELPQIFNVIKGEMSLVGPRPYLPSEAEDMGDYKDYILLTRPGITGLWQISGRSDLSFEDRLKLDTWYVLNWSLWLDLYIILKTFLVVLSKKGAY